MNKTSDKHFHIGHRKRLKEKFLSSPESISNYELIELLLFYVFRQRDTKLLAKMLCARFPTLYEMVFANARDLLSIDGIGNSVVVLFRIVHEICTRISFEQIDERQVVNSLDSVISYYKTLLCNDIREQMRIMFLDKKGKLIREQQLSSGTIDQTAVYPREIIQQTLNYGASAIILVHNHPSGDPSPSRKDIIATKKIQAICTELDIILLDHIIIGQYGIKSLKNLGII